MMVEIKEILSHVPFDALPSRKTRLILRSRKNTYFIHTTLSNILDTLFSTTPISSTQEHPEPWAHIAPLLAHFTGIPAVAL